MGLIISILIVFLAIIVAESATVGKNDVGERARIPKNGHPGPPLTSFSVQVGPK